jgi:hypothetical protein
MQSRTHQLARKAAKLLGWERECVETKLLGGVTKLVCAGREQAKTGEFFPMVDAHPTRVLIQRKDWQISVYGVREGQTHPDAVGIVGQPDDTFVDKLFDAWKWDEFETEYNRLETKLAKNPEYRITNQKKIAKSRLHASQTEV